MNFRPTDVYIPDGDEIRRVAEEELAKQRYAEAKPTWFDEMAHGIAEFFRSLLDAESDGGWGPAAAIIVTVLIVAALIAALIVWGRPRASRSTRRTRTDLLGAPGHHSAAQLRAEAERAASAGDWDAATILRYRAVAQSLLERDLIDPAPGATAQAIAREAATVIQHEAADLSQAAGAFDDVRYLRHPSTAARYAHLAELDERLSRFSPAPLVTT